jgi:hypothetical protein
MNFPVVWTPPATEALTDIWVAAPDRQVVTDAENRMSYLLGLDPLGNSTPVSGGLYAIEVRPLRALFEMPAGGRFVRVVSVKELS